MNEFGEIGEFSENDFAVEKVEPLHQFANLMEITFNLTKVSKILFKSWSSNSTQNEEAFAFFLS